MSGTSASSAAATEQSNTQRRLQHNKIFGGKPLFILVYPLVYILELAGVSRALQITHWYQRDVARQTLHKNAAAGLNQASNNDFTNDFDMASSKSESNTPTQSVSLVSLSSHVLLTPSDYCTIYLDAIRWTKMVFLIFLNTI